MNKIINLNTHSYYSFLNSCLNVDDIIKHALDNKQEYACLVDINVMYGAIEFYQKCLQNNLKPILGLQFNYQNSDLVVIAKNQNGYKTLLKLSSNLMTNNPLDLNNYLSNDIFVIRLSGLLNLEFEGFFIDGNGLENSIACHSVFFEKPTDFGLYQVIKAIQNEDKLSPNQIQKTNEELCFWNDERMKTEYSEKSILNLEKLLSQCNLVLENDHSKNILKFPVPDGLSSKEYIKNLCVKFLKEYLNSNPYLDKRKYADRLAYELEIINEKGFNDYFLIVQDFINWAKQNKIIVGPGRGSAAGSLVSFCLNITEIDPIQYNLIFERFLNKDRMSMPDIDTDIMDSRRDEVIDYLFKKYGEEHVAHIITFSRMKAKMAIRDVGRVLNIIPSIVDKIAKNISSEYELDILLAIKGSSLLTEEYTQNKTLFDYSNKLIGFPRQFGTHAAGIVLSNSKLSDVLPVQSGINDKSMCQYSMEYLEDLGLIKMDLLGLRNLTILDGILKLIRYTRGIDIDLQKLDLQDKSTFEMLSKGETNGIFQLESDGMRRILKRMNPENIEDISLVSAMYRPGAMQNINLYLARRKNNEQPKYLNSDIERILYPTYGVIIYQEQIIQLVQIIAKFDGSKSDSFRRAISKKKESVILEMKKEFVTAAIQNNYSEKDALEIFEYMEQFANYGFNHSHSLAYSYISYWLAYLKCHYPLETISVLLSFGDSSKEKILSYIKESKELGIRICRPDINLSTTNFVIHKNEIIFSLISISGLGNETSKKILEIRNTMPNKRFDDAIKAIAILSNRGVSTKVIESLIKVGAFDSLEPRRQFLIDNLTKITNKKMNLLDQNNNFIFDLGLTDNSIENYEEYSAWETKLLGLSFVKTKEQQIFDEYEKKFNLVSFDEVNDSNKFNSLVKLEKVLLTQSSTNKTILKITVVQNNKKYYLYSFSDVQNQYDKIKDSKYFVGTFKPYRDTFTLQDVLSKIGE